MKPKTDVDALKNIVLTQARKHVGALPKSFSVQKEYNQPKMRITHRPSGRTISVGLCDFQGAVQGIKFAHVAMMEYIQSELSN